MEPSRNFPSVEQHVVSDKNYIPSNTQQQEFSDSARFFVLKTTNTFSTVSPFLIEKAITSSIGPVKTIRKMRSGDLFLEVASAKQSSALRTPAVLGRSNRFVRCAPGTCSSKRRRRNRRTALIHLRKLAHLDVTVAPHTTLNFSRGVISPADFLSMCRL
ncbi:hypothetical protein TNCV_3677901 [Trichonephila clavipes]|nr:hypothetical protein TNCV_3677901 [Trichonephila clavipes]